MHERKSFEHAWLATSHTQTQTCTQHTHAYTHAHITFTHAHNTHMHTYMHTSHSHTRAKDTWVVANQRKPLRGIAMMFGIERLVCTQLRAEVIADTSCAWRLRLRELDVSDPTRKYLCCYCNQRLRSLHAFAFAPAIWIAACMRTCPCTCL